MRTLLLLSLLLFVSASSAEPLTFTVEEGGQTNVFLDDDLAQVHLLLRPGRLVFAFPSENTGVGVWFDGGLEIVPDSLVPHPGNGHNQEVEVKLRVLRPTIVQKVVLDSIRTLRDESEGAETVSKIEQARAEAGGDATRTARHIEAMSETGLASVHYMRQQRFLANEAGDFGLDLPLAKVDSEDRVILSPGTISMVCRVPYKPMRRFQTEALYSPAYLADLKRDKGRVDTSLKALEFLARHEKMMAGSWRFLTYFGRDTLISLAMLEPILSDEALDAGVRSVLDRLSPEGMVAHEEDIGPWAEWRHLQAKDGKTDEPVYDQKMIDDDLLLPVLLAKLRENGRGAVVDGLMADAGSRAAVLRNADYVYGLLCKKKLIRLNPGESTGDWRDSHEGLGGGVYPASVNCDLALPALDALVMLYGSQTSPPSDKLERLKTLRPVWQKLAAGYWTELSPTQVKERLARFSSTLSPERKAVFETLVRARADLLDKPFRFPVLSFNDDMSPVVVPHTDVAFTLFYGHPDQAQVQDILTLLERPFPYGLATPAGHLVASPVFSTNPGHYRSLGFGQYHGLVVWSWPSAMLQFGLMRQRGRFPALDSRIDALLADIAASETRVGPLATSELWAIELEPTGITWRAYGVQGDQAESNALQLWSTVYPALVYVRERPLQKP